MESLILIKEQKIAQYIIAINAAFFINLMLTEAIAIIFLELDF